MIGIWRFLLPWGLFVTVLCYVGCLHIPLDGKDWVLSNSNRSVYIQAKVPGDVYTDLMRGHILLGDPYYMNNDVMWRWVAYSNWTWTTNFTVSNSVPEKTFLVAKGLDTVTMVTLNDQWAGQSNNMFIRAEFDVSRILQVGSNHLSVTIASPVVYAREQASFSSYAVPPACVPDLFHGECHANFIRKEQRSFGWDLGPAFPTMGIWKSIYIESRETCQIQDVTVHVQRNADMLTWSVLGKVYMKSRGPPLCHGFLRAEIPELGVALRSEYRAETYTKFTLRTTKQKPPSLWWPHGHGPARLYTMTVRLETVDGVFLSERSVSVGFRTVSLVQEVQHGMRGLSFYFRVNDRPIFAKGTNWVPSDAFQGRVTDEKISYLLRSARDVGMNMIRVWGGGIYERSGFYRLCDELGLMVWQDMMFAGSMYPVNHHFLNSVNTEATQQVRRLQHHASIVVWSANSENEEFLANNTFGTQSNFSLYKSDYVRLYVDTVMAAVRAVDPFRPLLSCTQSNGVHTQMAGWVAENPNSEIYGDVHFYHYRGNVWDWRVYPVPKFASEFGFQSLPSFYTLMNVSRPEDWDVDSPFWTHRQHHANGMKELKDCAETLFQLPNSTDSLRRFRHFLYLYQVNQAMVVKTETENYRVSRDRIMPYSDKGGTMGALFWQLNDIWPAPSWGSLDSSGRWKLLHYFTKNFFSSTLIVPQLTYSDDSFNVYLVNDLPLKTHRRNYQIVNNLRAKTSRNRGKMRQIRNGVNYGRRTYYGLSRVVDRAQDWQNSMYRMRMNREFRTMEVDSEFMLVLKVYQWWQIGRPVVVNVPVTIDERRHSQLIHTRTFSSIGCRRNAPGCLVTMEFHHGNNMLSENFLLSTGPRNLTDYLLSPNIRITDVIEDNKRKFIITLTTEQIALFVTMETSVRGTFTENGFHMVSHGKTIEFELLEEVSVPNFRDKLVVTSLWDLYHK